jgi:hypothetical protein
MDVSYALSHHLNGSGMVMNCLACIKNVLVKCLFILGEVSLYFKFELKTVSFLNVFMDKNVKD